MVTVSRRLRVPYPVLLLLGGLAIGALPIALLDGEALLNDATALTVYKVALVAAAAAAPSLSPAPIGSFFVVAAFGIAVGLAVGWVVAWIRSRLSDVPVEITVSLLTPYAA